MSLVQDILNAWLTLVEQSSTPDSPAAGDQLIFIRTSDHALCRVNSSGTVTVIEGGSGGVVKIAETVLASPAANFDFTSIPGTYSHLKVLLQGRGTTAAGQTDIQMLLNNDTGANYDNELLNGVNTTASASNVTAGAGNYIGNIPAANATANFAGSLEITLFNYARTVFYKNYQGLSGNMATAATDALNRFSAGQWRNTAAVTRVTLVPGAGNFDTGCVATLYGLA